MVIHKSTLKKNEINIGSRKTMTNHLKIYCTIDGGNRLEVNNHQGTDVDSFEAFDVLV